MLATTMFDDPNIKIEICDLKNPDCDNCLVIPQTRESLPLMVEEIREKIEELLITEDKDHEVLWTQISQQIGRTMTAMEMLGEEYYEEIYPLWIRLAHLSDISDPEEIQEKWNQDARPKDQSLREWEEEILTNDKVKRTEGMILLTSNTPEAIMALDKVGEALESLESLIEILNGKVVQAETIIGLRLYLLETGAFAKMLDACAIFKDSEEHKIRAENFYKRLVAFMYSNDHEFPSDLDWSKIEIPELYFKEGKKKE